jgi:predicted dehydrogenase
VKSVYAQAAVHIADRWDENGEHYTATAEDAAYGIFELDGDIVAQINSSWTVRVNRDELVEFHVDGTHGSAVVGLFGAKIQHRNATPKPVWNPDLADDHDYDADWAELPVNDVFQNGFRQQWEEFLTSYVLDTPYEFDLLSGARGVLLAEAGLESSREGRKVALRTLSLD